MTCKDCYHFEACYRKYDATPHYTNSHVEKNVERICTLFNDKATILKLPCKMGDTIYRILYDHHDKEYYISYMKIRTVKDMLIFFTGLRKSTFLTSEEAEKALEGLKNG